MSIKFQIKDSDKIFWYRAKVTRLVDADTLDLYVDLGFNQFAKIRVRLKNVDTPEIYGVSAQSEEFKKGQRAKQQVEKWIGGEEVYIRTYKKGSFGRWLAKVKKPESSTTINEKLKEIGYGKD